MPDTYRVDELARRADVSVHTVRYYQHRGLLPPPVRDGRVALYSRSHLERLARIRELKDRGLPLATIKRILEGTDPADAALVSAVEGTGEATLSLEDVARASGVEVSLLETLAAEGLLVPRAPGVERGFTHADVRAVRAGVALLEAGIPLADLLTLGRRYSATVDGVAEEAVELFDRHIRKPAREGNEPPVAGERLLEAFSRLLPAASALVGYDFERAVLSAARRRMGETPGTDPEFGEDLSR